MKKEFIQIEKRNLFKCWKIIIPVHVCFLLFSFLGVVDYFREKNLLCGLMINEFYHVFLIGIIVYLLKDFLLEMWKNLKNIGAKANTKRILFGVLIIFVFNFGYRILTTICFAKITTGQNQTMINEYLSEYPIMTFVLSVFLGTFTEEIIYRGIIFQTLRQKGKVCACVGSALLFGLIHVITTITQGTYNLSTTVVLLFNYIVLGFAFAIIYEKYRNIYVNYFVHMIWNAISSSMALLALYINSLIK